MRTRDCYTFLQSRLPLIQGRGKPEERAKAIFETRELCLSDLFFLCKFVLGYDWLEDTPHLDFCHEIEKDRPDSLYLLHRGGCKCVAEDTLIENLGLSNNRLAESVIVTGKTFSWDDSYYVRTRAGKELTCTNNHPFKTLLSWKSAETLKTGDRIATARFLPPITPKYDADTCYCIGAIIGDGMVRVSTVILSTADDVILASFNKIGWTCTHYRNYDYHVRKAVTTIRKIGLHGKLSYDKFIPYEVKGSAELLAGLFDTDGDINGASKKVTFTTVSRRLADDIQSELLRFGIISRIFKRKTDSPFGHAFLVTVGGADELRKFYNTIPIRVEKKKNKLREVCEFSNRFGNRNTNVDTIPPEWRKMLAFGDSYHLKQMGLHIDNHYATSRAKLSDVGEFLRRPDIISLANSDVFWDEVAEVRRVDHPVLMKEIQSEPYHNYVTSNGIINHNTLIFTIGDGIRWYLREPETPIAIVCDALKRSTKKLRAIRWHFENNTTLRELFPDLIWAIPSKDAPKWTDEELLMPKHTGRQEPSFLATSLENQPTGLHFPRIKCDDIVTPETSTTKDQIDKNREQFGMMRSSILQSGGNISIVGTIYDDADLHCEMMKEGSGYFVYRKPAIDPATGDPWWPEQFGVERLNKIRKDPTVSEYVFSCLTGEMKILMGDWTQKPIKDVQVGDVVIGFKNEEGAKARTKCCFSKVLYKNIRESEVVRSVMADGSVLEHTPDHKWWSGRRGVERGKKNPRQAYSTLGFSRNHDQQGLCRFVDFREWDREYSQEERDAMAWLGGFFDGEGSVSGGCINFTQSFEHHPEVVKKLYQCLDLLGFQYGTWEDKRERDDCKRKSGLTVYLTGGRNDKVKFISLCKPSKRQQIINGLMAKNSNCGAKGRIPLASQTLIGNKIVYNIQTETGNYFAEGFGSKNCQYLLDPSPENENAYFQMAWFGRYEQVPELLYYYVGMDLALSKKQAGDYTVFVIAGVDENNLLYIVDVWRGHWDSAEIVDEMFKVQRVYSPMIWSGQKDLIQRAIGPFLRTRMIAENCFVNLDDRMPMKDKVTNARSIQGRIKAGSVFLPAHNQKQPDWLQPLEFELKRFPKGKHDDTVDALAFLGLQLDDQISPAVTPEVRKTLAQIHLEQLEKPSGESDERDLYLLSEAEKNWSYYDYWGMRPPQDLIIYDLKGR